MKILFTVENYYPKMSGVPNVVKYLSETLAIKGHDVTVVTKSVKGYPHEEIINSVKIVRKNIYYSKIKTFKGNTKDYIDFVLNFDCDVIIFECSQCITTDLLLPHLYKINKKKILHSHGFSGLTLSPFTYKYNIRNTIANTYNWIKWNLYYKLKFKKYVNQFDDTICLSELDSSKSYLDKFSRKVHVLSNAADDVFFSDELYSDRIDKYIKLEGKKYFISIANYEEYKNQIGILEQYFEADTTDYDMVFIGSRKTEYYESLIVKYEKLKSIYGEKKVHFLIGVERDDIPSILKGAELYLVGSYFEEFSISIIESMALGVPFISTNVGNAKLLPGGVTINSIGEMSQNINDLLRDEMKYRLYKEQGIIYSRNNCRISTVTNNLEAIIDNIN